MRNARLSLKAALAAGFLSLSLVPASAQMATFIDATCGVGCPDPAGEEAAARQNWSAMQALGTTRWIGSTIGGGTVDASSLLAAARVGGAAELDNWLNTGNAPDTGVAQGMSTALQNVRGVDVSAITGDTGAAGQAGAFGNGATQSPLGSGSLGSSGSSSSLTNSLEGMLTNALAGNTSFQGPGGGGGSGYCDQGVGEAITAAAQRTVNNFQTIATSGDYGFSQLGGSAISSGQRSASGYTGSSCLDSLMQGTRDMLFKPPQLSQLLGSLMSMFGGSGGSGGGCAAAQSIMSQVSGSLPNGIFSTGGMGGFFPYMAGQGGEGTGSGNSLSFSSGFNLANAVGATSFGGGQQASTISRLFR